MLEMKVEFIDRLAVIGRFGTNTDLPTCLSALITSLQMAEWDVTSQQMKECAVI